MSDEIRLELRSVKNTSVLLDWVPIVGKIRMNNLKTEHSMIKKMNCFGWHFDCHRHGAIRILPAEGAAPQ